MRSVGMGQHRGAAAELHALGAADIGFGRERAGWRRIVGRAGGKTDSDIVLRHDDGAVLVKGFVATGLLAVKMAVDPSHGALPSLVTA